MPEHKNSTPEGASTIEPEELRQVLTPVMSALVPAYQSVVYAPEDFTKSEEETRRVLNTETRPFSDKSISFEAVKCVLRHQHVELMLSLYKDDPQSSTGRRMAEANIQDFYDFYGID